MTECRTRKRQVEVLSSRRFVQKVGEMAFFFVGDATQAHGDWLARLKILDGPKHAFLPRNGTNGHEQPRSVPSGSIKSNRVKTRPYTLYRISRC